MPIEKRWVVKPQGDSEAVAKLAAVLRISPVLANLLVQRGIDTVEKADKFFKPSLADLHDPFLMKDMDKAVERVEQAVRNNEKIMVYGDYDVDGCTAVALVYKFLRQIGHKNLMFYIPDRYTEGYGISIKGIDLAARKGVGLIIALDCGIKATEKVVYAKTKGVDFIICDHHLPAEEIPKAVAVLDPKRVDCSYPFDELSGCGVGFKLVQAYAQKNRMPFEQILPLLDLLVVSIASDIVPLVGENRILAYFGLKNLNREPSKGLLSIIKICGLDKHNITIDDIVFKIGPRINAAGRMRMDENDENASPSGGHAAVEHICPGKRVQQALQLCDTVLHGGLISSELEIRNVLIGVVDHGVIVTGDVLQRIIYTLCAPQHRAAELTGSVFRGGGGLGLYDVDDGLGLGEVEPAV